jgi:hypothetical protein
MEAAIVSRGDCAISRRTVMKYCGYAIEKLLTDPVHRRSIIS